MKLYERLFKFKQEERFTYKEIGQMIDKPLSFVYDFCHRKAKYLDPDFAVEINEFLKERGY